MEDHVHDCTGPDMRCPCGYVFSMPPVSVEISVRWRNTPLVDECFNCDTIEGAAKALRYALERLGEESGSR